MKLFLLALIIVVTVSVKAQTNAASVQDTTVYMSKDVTVKPQFVGGMQTMGSFLNSNVRYPKYAREHNIQGKVLISFIIEKDGTLTGFKIIKSVSKELDAETMRVMKLSPAWEPAKIDDRVVRCWFEMPLSYTLETH